MCGHLTHRLKQIIVALLFLWHCTDGLNPDIRGHVGCAAPKSFSDTPFYYGTTDLACMGFGKFGIGKRKKRSPSRFPWAPVHSWIHYRGHYFEFGVDQSEWKMSRKLDVSIRIDRPSYGNRCDHKREKTPKGFSSVPIECIFNCCLNYKRHFGPYHLFLNNCHNFVNRISEALCSNRCPSWCVM